MEIYLYAMTDNLYFCTISEFYSTNYFVIAVIEKKKTGKLMDFLKYFWWVRYEIW